MTTAGTLPDECEVGYLTEVKVGVLCTMHSSVWPSPASLAGNTSRISDGKHLRRLLFKQLLFHAVSEKVSQMHF